MNDSKRFAHLEEVVRYVPLDRMLIETDAPFMLPKNVLQSQLSQYQLRRNEPAFLPYVAQTIAQFKNIPLETVASATTLNVQTLFKL